MTTNLTAAQALEEATRLAQGFAIRAPGGWTWVRPDEEVLEAITTGLASRLQYGPACPTTVSKELARVFAPRIKAEGLVRREIAYRDHPRQVTPFLILVRSDGTFVA